MSLINEALKRTRDASMQSGRAMPSSAPNYRYSGNGNTNSARSITVFATTILVGFAVVGGVILVGIRIPKPVASVNSALTVSSSTPKPVNQHLRRELSNLVAIDHPTPTVAQGEPVTPLTEEAATENPPEPVAKSTEDGVIARVFEKLKTDSVSHARQSATPEPPKLVLQGVTIGGSIREAMINGYTLKEGEDIQGARVMAIENRTVKLEYGGREFTLRMP